MRKLQMPRMSQSLVSDMFRSTLGVFCDHVERQQTFSREDAMELLSTCDIVRLVMDRSWELTQGQLNSGIEGKKMAATLNEYIALFESSERAFGVGLNRIRAANLTHVEQAKGLSLLKELQQIAEKRRQELSKLLQWLQAPRSDTGFASLPGDRGTKDAAGYIGLDEFNAQFLAGGDK
jgi:hypothetical protein